MNNLSNIHLYKAIIQQAKDQLKSKACFVAGTLVHTKEGLRPIEEIKVGDYVLSKPESGVGELSYQRVTRTFVHENQEVWALHYLSREILSSGKREGGLLVATENHPIWQVYAYSSLFSSHIKPSKPSQRWMSVYEHFEETAEGYGGGLIAC